MPLPKRTQQREVSLLMHYLDDIFPFQFSLYHHDYVGRREWLLPLLTSTRAVYYATLCLSLLHKERSSSSPGGDGDGDANGEKQPSPFWREERIRYYILALRETQLLLQSLTPTFSLETVKGSVHSLASTLHLISYEVSSIPHPQPGEKQKKKKREVTDGSSHPASSTGIGGFTSKQRRP